MASFQVAAIPTAVAESVRNTQKAPGYGFPAHKEVAAGPCRHCLRLIKVNEEELYLFDYDPFCELGVPPLPGPVYVHARDCEQHNGGGAFPEEYHGRLLTLDAYGEDRTLVTEVRVSGCDEGKARGDAVRRSTGEIHSRAEYRGGVLFVSVGPGVKRRQRCAGHCTDEKHDPNAPRAFHPARPTSSTLKG